MVASSLNGIEDPDGSFAEEIVHVGARGGEFPGGLLERGGAGGHDF